MTSTPPSGPGWTDDDTAPPPAPDLQPGAGGHGVGGATTPPPPPPPDDEDGPSWVVVGLVGVVVLGLVALGVFGLTRSGDTPVAAPTATATPPEPTDPTAPSTPSPTPTTPADPGPTATPDPGDDPLGDLGLDPEALGADAELFQCLLGDGQPSLGGAQLPDDPTERIRAIADQVAELRGLDVDTEVDLELLSSDELTQRVTDIILEDYPVSEAALDDAIYTTLGQLSPDRDLRDVLVGLLGEQVAGFYDPETGELVAEAGADPSPDQLVIIAHELDHALTDAALDAPSLSIDGDVDRELAHQALLEGDATVLMQQWALANLGFGELMSLGAGPVETEQLDSAPAVLQAQLLAPYTDGLTFVCSLYNDGGWAAVDAAYDDPPSTTAQVLFPQRYTDREDAVEVAGLSAGDGWQQQRDTTYGAAELLWLLQAPGDDPARGPADARDRVADWAGGRQVTWQDGDDTMVALHLAQQDGGDLCSSLQDWAAAAWPSAELSTDDDTSRFVADDRVVEVRCPGTGEITTVVGPDAQAVDTVSTG